MVKLGPIIIVEDDLDDQDILKEVLNDLMVTNEQLFFTTAQAAWDYLMITEEQPFLIMSDINLPGMNGLEFRKAITENDYLRSKSIPFIFHTTSADRTAVKKAYELVVQGFFQKQVSISALKNDLKLIIDYWKTCKHPNTNNF